MLRNLRAVVHTDRQAAGRPCGRCGAHMMAGPVVEIIRPGRSKGVAWCPSCAAPYLTEEQCSTSPPI